MTCASTKVKLPRGQEVGHEANDQKHVDRIERNARGKVLNLNLVHSHRQQQRRKNLRDKISGFVRSIKLPKQLGRLNRHRYVSTGLLSRPEGAPHFLRSWKKHNVCLRLAGIRTGCNYLITAPSLRHTLLMFLIRFYILMTSATSCQSGCFMCRQKPYLTHYEAW